MSENEIKVKTLITEDKLMSRVNELAQKINFDYEGQEIVAVCVLKGSFVFFADLVRGLEMPITCEFMGISSYGNEMRSSGEVKLTLDINEPLENRHVLVIEDIVDTGLTLRYIQNLLRSRNPASVKSCALLYKPDKLETQVDLDYVGFEINDEFVVGYGIDYKQKMRGLPYIAYVDRDH